MAFFVDRTGAYCRIALVSYLPNPPREEKEPRERCSLCERLYTETNKPVSTIIGTATIGLQRSS